MVKQIFVNLPVKDLEKTKEFWGKLGFSFNPQFTDRRAAALVLSENIFSMLITEAFFKTFTNKEIADSSKTTEVINAVSVESREEVDRIADAAMKAGAKPAKDSQDMGWMYYRSFLDLDGHHWEVTFIDEKAVPANPGQSS